MTAMAILLAGTGKMATGIDKYLLAYHCILSLYTHTHTHSATQITHTLKMPRLNIQKPKLSLKCHLSSHRHWRQTLLQPNIRYFNICVPFMLMFVCVYVCMRGCIHFYVCVCICASVYFNGCLFSPLLTSF